MANLIFFRDRDEIATADDFIPRQLVEFRERLESAALELSRTGQISEFNASRLNNGQWSIWLMDTSGELTNFRLYTSPLADFGKRPPVAPKSRRRLVIREEEAGRPGENIVFTAADAYLQRRYSGAVREKLLAALDRALHGLPHIDGTVEFDSGGVTLRALSKTDGLKKYDAEIHFEWVED